MPVPGDVFREGHLPSRRTSPFAYKRKVSIPAKTTQASRYGCALKGAHDITHVSGSTARTFADHQGGWTPWECEITSLRSRRARGGLDRGGTHGSVKKDIAFNGKRLRADRRAGPQR